MKVEQKLMKLSKRKPGFVTGIFTLTLLPRRRHDPKMLSEGQSETPVCYTEFIQTKGKAYGANSSYKTNGRRR